jgi:hypothetical protein
MSKGHLRCAQKGHARADQPSLTLWAKVKIGRITYQLVCDVPLA